MRALKEEIALIESTLRRTTQMDGAVDQIKEILKSLVNQETFQLKQEIKS